LAQFLQLFLHFSYKATKVFMKMSGGPSSEAIELAEKPVLGIRIHMFLGIPDGMRIR
jgi:hypothetical protein